MFNKNRKICTSATAIIIMSLSSLSLNVGGDGHTSAFLLFSTEPVFAQLSRQSIPYGEEQIPTRPSSSSSASTMDFGLFMDSIANSIFNGTSTFAGLGNSIVDGIDVSGINLDKSQNKLSVILSRTATTQVEGNNNNIASTDTTITELSGIPNSNPVSVIAMRIPISTSDILSIAAASSSSSSLNALDSSIGDDTTENQLDSFPSDSFNPLSLLSSLQIGSSTLIDVDWSEPQTVTMDLVGSGTTNQEQEQQINSANATMAEIVLVSVIPYTGVGNNTTSSTT
jgi:hypothetical protein